MFITNVNASNFKSAISVGDKFIWKCNLCKESKMNEIFGAGWDDDNTFKNLSKGKKMKWEIISKEVNETHIKVEFDIWFWANNKIWGVNDSKSRIIYFSDPDDYSEKLNFSSYKSLLPFWFPVPVGEYMGKLNLNDWYEVDNRVLPTLNVQIGKNEITSGTPNEDIKIIAIYGDNGIINSYKLYIKDFRVIIDISLDYLPWYVIPSVTILLIVFSLGIIFYIIRKIKRNKPIPPND